MLPRSITPGVLLVGRALNVARVRRTVIPYVEFPSGTILARFVRVFFSIYVLRREGILFLRALRHVFALGNSPGEGGWLRGALFLPTGVN